MPSFTMKDGVLTLAETITGISIKSIDQVTQHQIEQRDGRVFHRISFSNGGLADVSWGEGGFSCHLEKVSQTYSPDPDVDNGVTITLFEGKD